MIRFVHFESMQVTALLIFNYKSTHYKQRTGNLALNTILFASNYKKKKR